MLAKSFCRIESSHSYRTKGHYHHRHHLKLKIAVQEKEEAGHLLIPVLNMKMIMTLCAVHKK